MTDERIEEIKERFGRLLEKETPMTSQDLSYLLTRIDELERDNEVMAKAIISWEKEVENLVHALRTGDIRKQQEALRVYNVPR